MTPEEIKTFVETSTAKQAAYREQRRVWSLAHDNPYEEDGGKRGGRSGDAKPRVAQTHTGTNF
jgi:hypothetical protein